MFSKIIISQPANPEYLKDWFDYDRETITGLYLLSVDYPPLIINQNQSTKFFHKKPTHTEFDCATIVLTTQPTHQVNQKTYYLLATDVRYECAQLNGEQNLTHNLVLTGKVDVINALMENLIKTHRNYQDINFDQLDTLITTSNDQQTIKAYRKLTKWFLPDQASHLNIFKLFEHNQKAQTISKNLNLKKIIAFYYKSQALLQGGN